MHDFIVRKGKDEIFVMMIEHRESEVVLVVFAINRIAAEIPEGVVHPTHVPFECESKAPQIGRTSDEGPRSGFFGNGPHAGMFGVDEMVEVAQEFNRLQVLPSAELI